MCWLQPYGGWLPDLTLECCHCWVAGSVCTTAGAGCCAVPAQCVRLCSQPRLAAHVWSCGRSIAHIRVLVLLGTWPRPQLWECYGNFGWYGHVNASHGCWHRVTVGQVTRGQLQPVLICIVTARCGKLPMVSPYRQSLGSHQQHAALMPQAWGGMVCGAACSRDCSIVPAAALVW